jgi:hypothetical protein
MGVAVGHAAPTSERHHSKRRDCFILGANVDFSIRQIRADGAKGAAIIVGMYDGGKFAPAAKAVDRASSGYLTALQRRGDLQAVRAPCCTRCRRWRRNA